MQFASVTFLFFFLPVAILVYHLLYFSLKAQNVWLLITSLVFYAWGEPTLVVLLIALILVNYFFGLALDTPNRNARRKKALVICAVILNLAVLVVFRYLRGIWNSTYPLFASGSGGLIGALPRILGVSFITLQGISYVVDVYRRDIPAERRITYVALYLAMFPRVVAGPIVRYGGIAPQLAIRRTTWYGFSRGMCRFATGFAKRVLFAGTLGAVADRIFDMTSLSRDVLSIPALLAWLGIVAFALQVYHGFSGYSDMAIGLGAMMGFTFPENFDYPYAALSVTSFWGRWHITLVKWFDQYVYEPLGGAQVANNDHMVRNLLTVCLLMGLWYCADLSFVLWGVWFFIFLLIERVIGLEERRIPVVIRHFYTLLVVLIGCVFLRGNGIYQVLAYLSNLFGIGGNGFFSGLAWIFLRENAVWFALAIVFATPVAKKIRLLLETDSMGIWGKLCSVVYPLAVGVALILAVLYLATGQYVTPVMPYN